MQPMMIRNYPQNMNDTKSSTKQSTRPDTYSNQNILITGTRDAPSSRINNTFDVGNLNHQSSILIIDEYNQVEKKDQRNVIEEADPRTRNDQQTIQENTTNSQKYYDTRENDEVMQAEEYYETTKNDIGYNKGSFSIEEQQQINSVSDFNQPTSTLSTFDQQQRPKITISDLM